MGILSENKLTGSTLAVRCHDITVSLQGKQVGDFENLIIYGMAVRLALHIRGLQAVPYDLLKQVALHMLHIPPTSLPVVVETLGEAEFVRIDKRGKSIKSIVPTVPYYEDLFKDIGDMSNESDFSEPEQLTLMMLDRLARSPANKNLFLNSGAESNLVNRMISVGEDGGYLISKRSRGKDMLLSPIYFSENADSFADLAAGSGSGKLSKVLSLLSAHQGWPLKVIKEQVALGDARLTQEELNIIVALAQDGFSQPPTIQTSHAGKNYFLFTPKPGMPKITPTKKAMYETAMALVAAVRQGQLLPAAYKIKYPVALLRALRDRKVIRANTEALEQYRTLVTLRLGYLEKVTSDWAKFHLIDTEENVETVDMAINLVLGKNTAPTVDDEAILAFQKGQSHLDSLVGRQMLVAQEKANLSQESINEIDDLLLRGAL